MSFDILNSLQTNETMPSTKAFAGLTMNPSFELFTYSDLFLKSIIL